MTTSPSSAVRKNTPHRPIRPKGDTGSALAGGGAGGHDFRTGWRDDGRDALSVPSPERVDNALGRAAAGLAVGLAAISVLDGSLLGIPIKDATSSIGMSNRHNQADIHVLISCRQRRPR